MSGRILIRTARVGDSDCAASFSEDEAYRYRLERIWDINKRPLAFCMLNPSTADELKNDPTVERCETRARNTPNCGGLIVVNAFALRSTDPRALYAHADPVGPENDVNIYAAAGDALMVVCGWGKHGALHGRGKNVVVLLRHNGFVPHALRLNGDGSPAHPLYLPYSAQPFPM